MTWTYSGDPSDSNRDAIRFAVGDTDSSDEQLSDEEIAYLLTEKGSVAKAAVAAAEAIYAKLVRKVDKSVGDLRISYSQLRDQYAALVTRLKKDLALGILPYAGGLSRSRKDTLRDETDLVQPSFRRGQFRNPDVADYDDDCDLDDR